MRENTTVNIALRNIRFTIIWKLLRNMVCRGEFVAQYFSSFCHDAHHVVFVVLFCGVSSSICLYISADSQVFKHPFNNFIYNCDPVPIKIPGWGVLNLCCLRSKTVFTLLDNNRFIETARPEFGRPIHCFPAPAP